jgi:hypothetical protein
MIIKFKQQFTLPVEEIFSYFRTPADWTRLFGLAGNVKNLGEGWFSIPLQSFPFPLVAKNTIVEPARQVQWKFRGFWRGEGEVTFEASNDQVTLEGYERISIRWLFCFSPIVEKLFLERHFREIWEIGWRRLRKAESLGHREKNISNGQDG